MKLPLDMKTVRQVLAIALKLYRQGDTSASNLVLGLVFAAISDTKWFGTGLRDWITLWNPEIARSAVVPADFDRLKVSQLISPIASELLQSGRRSQAARLVAAMVTLWPQVDWQEFAQAGVKGLFSQRPPQKTIRVDWMSGNDIVVPANNLPQAITIAGSSFSLAEHDVPDISFAKEYAELLKPRGGIQLSDPEIETVANAVYDFRWSGRSEEAVRLSAVLPRVAEMPDLYKRLDECAKAPHFASQKVSEAAQIAVGLKNKGYSAEGVNLLLDSLSLEEGNPEWDRLFKTVEPEVQLITGKTPNIVYSFARGLASKLTNESPTSGGPSKGEEKVGGAPPSSPPPPTGNASGEPDPPRTAYALLKCNDIVVAGRESPLLVGLAATPDSQTAGDQKLERPPSSVGPYDLQIQVTADGFQLRPGESWRNELRVTAQKPYPAITLHLTPEVQSGKNVWPRTITALYSVEGHSIGVAVRSVAVVRSEQYAAEADTPVQDSSATFPIPTDTVPPDLTVSIVRGTTSGRLLWTIDTPWKKTVVLPTKPLVVDVGGNGDGPKDYARQLVDSVNAHEGKGTLYNHLMGQGRTVGDLVPPEFWEVLRSVVKESGHTLPTILILSAEPYIPWELAVLEPPLDPKLPPFLGAQAVVGRWVLANRGPKLPPPKDQAAQDIAVVSGVYDSLPGWRRLKEAEMEAAEIAHAWSGKAVDAKTDPVLQCIGGTPPGDVLHFALHGIYDPASTLNGLVLVDGQSLDPMTIKGAKLARTPFVFLNACQVGEGNAVLGDYSGMAAAFLYAGASGVVAPLWSIKDTIARDIALRFYDQTFQGTAPAEFLRKERSQFTNPPKDGSATWLAYQYFGHPEMRLVRQPKVK